MAYENLDYTKTKAVDYDRSKVPTEITKRADYVRNKGRGGDVREALAQNAEIAGIIAQEAVGISKNTENRQGVVEKDFQNLNKRYDLAVSGHTTDTEVLDARINAFGIQKENLKSRLDYTDDRISLMAVNAKDFGLEDGVLTDQMPKIQEAIDYANDHGVRNVIIPDGTYHIDVTHGSSTYSGEATSTGLYLYDNTRLTGSKNTILKVMPNNFLAYNVFSISEKEDVSIENIEVIGDRYDHTYTGTGGGAGVEIADSNNIILKNMYIHDMWFDGISINGDVDRVVIDNTISDNNRKRGMSIKAGKIASIEFINSAFTNSGDIGLIFEAKNKNRLDMMSIRNCRFTGNAVSGIKFDVGLNYVIGNVELNKISTQELLIHNRLGTIEQMDINNIYVPNGQLKITSGVNDRISNITINHVLANTLYFGSASNVKVMNSKSKYITLNHNASYNFQFDNVQVGDVQVTLFGNKLKFTNSTISSITVHQGYNIVLDKNTYEFGITGWRVNLKKSNKVVISNSLFAGNEGYGISLDTGASEVVIKDNVIRDNLFEAIRINEGVSKVSILENYLYNNSDGITLYGASKGHFINFNHFIGSKYRDIFADAAAVASAGYYVGANDHSSVIKTNYVNGK